MPPNAIDMAVLLALNILEGYEVWVIGYYSDTRLLTVIEAIKISI
jgi:gamma-glutamyltranspeptidase